VQHWGLLRARYLRHTLTISSRNPRTGARSNVRGGRAGFRDDFKANDNVCRIRVKHGVPPSLLAAVAKQRKRVQPQAKSRGQGSGRTVCTLCYSHLLGNTTRFIDRRGAQFMRALLDRTDNVDMALAGYNAGPSAVDKFWR